ncbi:MAG: ABC-F family ATP-binding cassette domain-containing protein, partial [Chlamydiae bacterium]|nr:ABC-F family ATP-binding cassette domain-containing protein [Chlamydiota bacterium]
PYMTSTQIRRICGQMMFAQEAAQKKISLLSGGERSRVLLGKILATPTNLLLLDEPTHHLDLESIEGLLEAIALYQGAVVLVTHSEWILERFTPDLLIIFENGTQRNFLGNYLEFLEKEGWQALPSKPLKKDATSLSFVNSKEKKSLQKKIIQTEKQIELLELQKKEAEQTLEEACLNIPPSESILSELSLNISQMNREIDHLYEILEKLYASLEKGGSLLS